MNSIAIVGSRGYPSYYGGFETLVRTLAPYLAEQGHEVTVYGRKSEEEKRGNSIAPINVRSTWGIGGKSTSTLSHGCTACMDVTKRSYDAVLILNVAHGLFLRRLNHAGIPTAVNVDGIEWQREKWGAVAKRVFLEGAKRVSRYATELIMDSRALLPIWQSQFGRKGRFIPYGAPVIRSTEDGRIRQLGLLPHQYVLAVARLAPENNVDLLLDAAERVGQAFQVVVVGDGNYESSISVRVRKYDASGRVRWLGRINDQALLNELWVNAGVYWHGHSVGGTNPALLQALGAGAPTLALDTPYNREVIGNPQQLVSRDANQLASKITDFMSSQETRVEVSRRGQTLIGERYSWNDVCSKYDDLLVEIADRGRYHS